MNESEIFLSVILHPESATPHVYPSDVHVGTHGPAYLGDGDFLSLENRFLSTMNFTLSSILSLEKTFQVLSDVPHVEDEWTLVEKFIKAWKY